jgi:hypothetical protein
MKLKRKIDRIINNIKNLIVWFPVIWEDRQYDYAFMFAIFEKKLELMEKDTYNWFSLGTEKDRKRIKTAKILCKRLAEEQVYYEDNPIFPHTYYKYTQVRTDQDLNLLCETLRKYSLKWWD